MAQWSSLNMPLIDTPETVAKHSVRLQPPINLHASVTAALVPMYYSGGMKARVSPVQ